MARIGMAPLAVLAALGLAGCRSPGEHQESGVKESRIEGKTKLPQPTLNPGDVRDGGTGSQLTISADTFTPRKPEPPKAPAGSTATPPGAGAPPTQAGAAAPAGPPEQTAPVSRGAGAAASGGSRTSATDTGRTPSSADTGRATPAGSTGTRTGQAGGTSRPR